MADRLRPLPFRLPVRAGQDTGQERRTKDRRMNKHILVVDDLGANRDMRLHRRFSDLDPPAAVSAKSA